VPEVVGIEVVYALPGRQRVVRLLLDQPISAEEAVRASGLLEEFPELAGQALALGVFGRTVDGRHVLRAGDRVEIYRPLKVNPRDARRRAAAG
jgi:putative ubiquitin-RnfH superfamily antitoxin RatB of RatAB toxin-antitoxin module